MGEKGQTLYVWKNIQLVKSRLVLFIILFLASFVLFALNQFLFSSAALVIVPLAYVLGLYTYRSYLIWKSGSVGEERVAAALKALPDSYVLISGLVVPPNRGDIDHVVIGPNGIFVLEAKNYGGIISCDKDVWKKVRVSPDGKSHEAMIGSPSNQIKRNAKVLKDHILLKKREIFHGKSPHIWVHAILVFTNSRASLELSNPTVDIVELDNLVAHLTSLGSDFRLKKDEVERLALVLVRDCA
jgi:hypothetical protein